MIRTFVDSGVLIAAARGNQTNSDKALLLLGDHRRRILTTVFVKLETLPKAIFNPYPLQRYFFQEFFADPDVEWVSDLNAVTNIAMHEAEKHGLSAIDALHVGAAIWSGADELETSEKPNKPMYGVNALSVRYIADMYRVEQHILGNEVIN